MKIEMEFAKKYESQYDLLNFEIILRGKNNAESTFRLGGLYGAAYHCTFELDTASLFLADGKTCAFKTSLALAEHILQSFHNQSGAERIEEAKRIAYVKELFLEEVEKTFSENNMPLALTVRKCGWCQDENMDVDDYYPMFDQKLQKLAKEQAWDKLKAYLAKPDPDGDWEIHYIWNGNQEKLRQLADLLAKADIEDVNTWPCTTSWSEGYEVNLENGMCKAYKEYDMNQYLPSIIV